MDPNQDTSTPELQQVTATPLAPDAMPTFQQPAQYTAPIESVTPAINNPASMPPMQAEVATQPFSPIVPVEQPEVAVPQSATSSEVFGAIPQVANVDAVNQPKKSNKKLYILLGIFVVLLIGAAIVAWLLFLS